MPHELAFNWRPGILEWILVLELIALAAMGGFRYVARVLGRAAPTDFFVIFYRVFWSAMRNPRQYPVPVNYQPVLPRRKAPARVDLEENATGLTDEELERLMAGDDEEEPDADAPVAARTEPRRSEEDDGMGGTLQTELDVHVSVGGTPRLTGVEYGVLFVDVNVPPDDGRANQIVIRELAKLLSIQPHQVVITAGHSKADKTFRLSGVAADLLEERLELVRRQLPIRGPSLQSDPEETLGFRPGPE